MALTSGASAIVSGLCHAANAPGPLGGCKSTASWRRFREGKGMPVPVSELISRAKAEIRCISAEEAAQRIRTESGLILLDVREPEEHAKDSISASVNIPRGLLEMKIKDVCSNPDQPILIHCAGGGRAALATKSLKDMGYTAVSSIDARFSDLQSAVADDGS